MNVKQADCVHCAHLLQLQRCAEVMCLLCFFVYLQAMLRE